MAITGTFSGTTSNSRIKPTITWSAVQSVSGNYSDVTATLTYQRDNSKTTAGTWEGALTIGEQSVSGSKKLTITDGSAATALSATVRVYHDDEGQATITIGATGAISGSTLTKTTISKEVMLDTIARASGISCADAAIESSATIVVDRKSSHFAHSVAYSFGALQGYINSAGQVVEEETRFIATTVNFQLPTSFYGQIPNAPSGVCRLTCRTYYGAGQVGEETTAAFTVTADPEKCSPELEGAVYDCNEKTLALTGDPNTLVRYQSIARCEIRAQGRNGATIEDLRIGGAQVSDGALDIAQPAFDAVTFSATDSRGYKTTLTVPVTMIPYVPLTNNAIAQRTDPTSGNGRLTLQGSCWNGNFGKTDNSLSYEFAVNDGAVRHDRLEPGQDHSYTGQEPLTDLDYTRSHKLQVTVSDALMSVSRTLTVQKGEPVFDWGEADFQFHVPVAVPSLTVGGVPLDTYIRQVLAQSN